jgi:signal transduction histidine kinase
MHKFIGLLLFLSLSSLLTSQTTGTTDSLLKLLPAQKGDSNTVLLYIDIARQFESGEPKTAKLYYFKARDLSQKINYKAGVIKYIINYTYMLNIEGLYDSSLQLNLESVEISRQINDSLNLAKTLFNTGTSYRFKGEYESAVRYYEEGKDLFSKLGNVSFQVQTNDILQVLFYEMKEYKRAIEYGEKSVAEGRKLSNLYDLGISLNNLGLSYFMIKMTDSAKNVFEEALDIALKLGDKNMEISQYLNLGSVFLEKGEYRIMKENFEKALKLSKKLEYNQSEMLALKGLSFFYMFEKNFTLAKKYAHEALLISYNFNFKHDRISLFTQLSNISYAMQDIKLGENYATKSSLLSDSLLNETVQKNTLELEKKFETQRKEAQIKKLEADKKVQQLLIKQKSTLNYILIGAAISLFIVVLLSYRNYKQKQKLQQQRISEFETQQQLTATEAVLKGEEQERTRLAKDLHDGLGGMLSGIKYSFNTMKGNLVMTPVNAQAFERSMDMLDSSIQEMRRVAHNMMPEALVKFGLDTALKDFCNDINLSGALTVSYQSIGMENAAIEQTTAITIYRIIQELINNSMKHGEGKNAIVQMSKTNNILSITVEDDGKGFDTTMLNLSKGIGWENIKNRVDFLKGKLDINSQTGKGTSVLIEVDIL